MIDTLSFPGVFFYPCGRLEALFRVIYGILCLQYKSPGNALKTPYTPTLTVCITSLSVSPVPAASPAARYCLHSA